MTDRIEATNPWPPKPHTGTTFGSLRFRNFRLMAASYLLSNMGWWMLETALIWLVLSLTGSAAAVGLTAALLFLPTVVLGMAGGLLADRYPKRRILMFYYVGLTSLSFILTALTLSQLVQIWQLQLIAVGFGIVIAVGYPAQQAFVAEMVGPTQLRNAISITSAVIQIAGLAGPAVGGILISTVGPGWSFFVAAVCYWVPFVALIRLRADELHALPPVAAERGQLRAALRYSVNRPDVLWPMILVGLFGMFTGNLGLTLAVFAKAVYDWGPAGYGLFSAIVAVGSVGGAVISARQSRTRLRTLVVSAILLSTLFTLSAVAPAQAIFCALLLGVGASATFLQTSANSTVQLAADDSIRGRVLGVYSLVWFGGIAIGGPLLGTLYEHVGPRTGMLLSGAAAGAATLLIAARLSMHRRRSRRPRTWPQFTSSQETHSWLGGSENPDANCGFLTSAPWAGLYVEMSVEGRSEKLD